MADKCFTTELQTQPLKMEIPLDWACSLVTKGLLIMLEALSSVPRTTQT